MPRSTVHWPHVADMFAESELREVAPQGCQMHLSVSLTLSKFQQEEENCARETEAQENAESCPPTTPTRFDRCQSSPQSSTKCRPGRSRSEPQETMEPDPKTDSAEDPEPPVPPRDDGATRATLTESAFRALERQYQETLAELEAVPTLNKYREEFERLFGSFKSSFGNEQHLLALCGDLQSRRFHPALHPSSPPSMEPPSSRLTEVEAQMLEWQSEKEEQLESGKILKEAVEAAVEERCAVEEELRTALDQRRELERLLKIDIDEFGHLEYLPPEATNSSNFYPELEDRDDDGLEFPWSIPRRRDETGNCNPFLSPDQEMENRVGQETRAKEASERARRKAEDERQSWEREKAELRAELEGLGVGLQERASEARQSADASSRFQQEAEALRLELDGLSRANWVQSESIRELEETMSALSRDVVAKEKDIAALRDALRESDKELQDVKKQLQTSRIRLSTSEAQRKGIWWQLKEAHRELIATRRQVERERHSVQRLTRETETLRQSCRNFESGLEDKDKSIQLMKKEDGRKDEELCKLQRAIYVLEESVTGVTRERDRIRGERETLKETIEGMRAEIHALETRLAEERRATKDLKAGLHDRDLRLSEVSAQKNKYLRKASEAEENLAQTSGKMKLLAHQLHQAREKQDSTAKALAAACLTDETLRKDVSKLREQANAAKEEKAALEAALRRSVDAHAALERRLDDADSRIREADESLRTLAKERDDLRAQLVERRDELELTKGDAALGRRVISRFDADRASLAEENHRLSAELARKERERSLALASLASTEEKLRRRLSLEESLRRDAATLERAKAELSVPVNCHRWRYLEGRDPTKVQLLLKLSTVQRRLVKSARRSDDNQRLLDQRENLCLDLMKRLERADRLQEKYSQPTTYRSRSLTDEKEKEEEEEKEDEGEEEKEEEEKEEEDKS
ncbi:unnamed protein product [Darwinula stevensoni]|uniref:Uncharacterized protein n=1 Tax=Darwinula stevensoni TaxID=69355 RepID=A0A7R9A3J1_9CRUS|nr:unnamed protein product [Darwinula stevensoni]CAG0888043.1 unnamed protein product [Darwinula stevensoni]